MAGIRIKYIDGTFHEVEFTPIDLIKVERWAGKPLKQIEGFEVDFRVAHFALQRTGLVGGDFESWVVKVQEAEPLDDPKATIEAQ